MENDELKNLNDWINKLKEDIKVLAFKKIELENNKDQIINAIKKTQSDVKMLRSQLSRATKRVNELKTDIAIDQRKQSDQELYAKLISIHARSMNGYIVEFLRLKPNLNTQDICHMFKMIGQPKKYKTIYKTLDDLMLKNIVEKNDPYTYKLVDTESKPSHN